MGFRRVTKKFMKYLIPTLLVLLIIPVTEKRANAPKVFEPVTGGDTLHCAIRLGDFDNLNNGYHTGFHYELLKRFAMSQGDSAEVHLGESRGSYLDSVRLGKLDLLVLPASRAPQAEEFTALPIGDSSVVWILKADHQKYRQMLRWYDTFSESPSYSYTYDRFFRGYQPYLKEGKAEGIISPYDDLLKKYSNRIGWDWRMYAALIWSESKFRIQVHSPRGAFGLMQMIPSTAKNHKVKDPLDPEQNIRAGADYIHKLQNMFRSYAANEDELVKFTLAAYNAGEGRVQDCIKFARAMGASSSTWSGLCSVMPMMNSDSVAVAYGLHCGKFSGVETRAYVRAVLNQFDKFRGVAPRFASEPADSVWLAANRAEEEELEKEEAAVFAPDSLLSPDSLGRVNPGDEKTRDEEKEHDDDVSGSVRGKH